MAEIKRTFTAARMNKDIDERLIPNGEYRHANNIQVVTTDSGTGNDGAAGTVQNIKGNVEIGVTTSQTNVSNSMCVGSVADEKNNKGYFLFASDPLPTENLVSSITTRKKYIDYIIEQDSLEATQVVFVDVFAVVDTYANSGSPTSGAKWTKLEGFVQAFVDELRVGMTIKIYDSNGALLTNESAPYITKIDGTSIYVNEVQTNTIDSTGGVIVVEHPKVLGFDQSTIITGINVLDDFLLYTCNNTEPKKINIKAAIKGNEGLTDRQTINQNIIDTESGEDYKDVTVDSNIYIDNTVKEEDITVIKKAPKLAPALNLFSSKHSGTEIWVANSYTGFLTDEGIVQAIGYFGEISGFDTFIDFAPGDSITLTSSIDGENKVSVVALITNIDDDVLSYQIVSINPSIQADHTEWTAVLTESKTKIFKYKFPRFAFRYKYDDGEYSSFSPFSEIAFLPGSYSLDAQDGYNLSMVNNLSKIEITNAFGSELNVPANVKCIDILYKSTDSPSVYLVKTLERDSSPEWISKANISITTEMINQIIPDDQILRAWDNVPRLAKAQEVIGNRLVYGNYVQGYNIPFKPLIEQSIISKYIGNSDDTLDKSLKSLRSYRLGIVFGDKYGRETPVVSINNIDTSVDEAGYTYGSGDVALSNLLSDRSNKFKVKQNWDSQETIKTPPSWAEYVKYYVKETSSDYYNLPMDRFYDSGDGNIWLSFNSSERNKVDEDTYLILKRASNTNTSVKGDYKYKIQSISNEAPDFIKTTRSVPKKLELGVYETVPAFINSLDQTAINIPEDTISDFMDVLSTNDDGNGGREIRLVCTVNDPELGQITLSTPYAMLLSSTDTSAADSGSVVFNILEPWQELAHFPQRLVDMELFGGSLSTATSAVMNGGLTAEIVNIFEKKSPEFEGKFFVKIKRDQALSRFVIGSSSVTEADYELQHTVGINYIDTSAGVNPGINGGQENHTWSGNWGIDHSNLGNASYTDDTEAFYETLSTRQVNYETHSNFKTGNIYHLWLDGARGYSGADGTVRQYEPLFRSGAGVTGNNVMAISYNETDSDYSITNPLGWTFNKLTQQGTVFSFENDREGTKYMVTGCETINVGNFAASLGGVSCLFPPITTGGGGGSGPTDQSGNRSFDDDVEDPTVGDGIVAHCKRIRKEITFNRLDANGQQEVDVGLDIGQFDPRGVLHHDGTSLDILRIHLWELRGGTEYTEVFSSPNPAVFETEPKESVDLEIYYEASNAIPQMLDVNTTSYFAPVGCTVSKVERDGIEYDVTKSVVEKTYDSAVKISVEGEGNELMSNNNIWKVLGVNATNTISTDGIAYTADNNSVTSTSGEFTFVKDSNSGPIINIVKDGLDLDAHSVYELSYEITSSDNNDCLSINPAVQDSTVIQSEDVTLDTTVGKHIKEFKALGSLIQIKRRNVGSFSVTIKDISLKKKFTGPSGIQKNDTIQFKHSDGTITRAVMQEYADANIDIDGCYRQSETHTIQGDWGIGSNGETEITFDTVSSGNAAVFDNFKVGDKVNGTGIPDGSFIKSINRQDSNPVVAQTTMKIDKVAAVTGNNVTLTISENNGYYKLNPEVYKQPVDLGWFNCYSYGNGVETNRIRDDFNAPKIDNGVKASTTFTGYKEDKLTNGMIYSGIYNPNSNVNNLNEFNMAMKITKELNPSYGSIQAMKTRDTDLNVFTEDKVFRVLANKDALYNADGNTNVTSSDRVLGQIIPYVGEYGVSKNPESIAQDQFRTYFTDLQRGAVLRLSRDGITPISNIGMRSYFRNKFKVSKVNNIIGSFDVVNGEYNLTLASSRESRGASETISFNETSKGWVSFKSFIQDSGISYGGEYITAKNNKIWKHYNNETRNNFYGTQYSSSVTLVTNDMPSTVKTFKAIGYEGSEGNSYNVTNVDSSDPETSGAIKLNDGLFNSLIPVQDGWKATIKTDMQSGEVDDFKNKENKWFGYIKGEHGSNISTSEVNESDFTTQGIGTVDAVGERDESRSRVEITIQN